MKNKPLSLSQLSSGPYVELYNDELAYINVLMQLKDHYVTPLTLYCEKKQIQNPFIGFPLDRIYKISIGFLHDIHQNAVHNSNAIGSTPSMAVVLNQSFSLSNLKHYTTLIGMIDVVIEQLEHLKKKKMSVEDFLESTENELLQQSQSNNKGQSALGSKTSRNKNGRSVNHVP